MYFEHVINGIIKRRCEQRGLNEKQSNEIIRTTNVLTKFTWLLSLLDLPTFSNTHYKTINLVMEKRNSIIHYKWNDTFDRDKTIDLRKEITDRDKLFRLIESAVKYMKKYETLIKFKKAKTLITKIHKL
ncbi:MAG: hypothetical protein DI539_24100 [Flavobacterium psychrophilum]|nr:MAG: hypothetical protein DI539_24100 [Flavobacterium psychrophilum]